MKRFYKFVSLGEGQGGFSILLDGKPVKTQARHLLQTEHRDLANAIVQEWVGQGDKILTSSMPLMQLLSTRIDHVSENRPAMTAALLKYLDTDLLCYRAEHPPEMARRQREAWDPWLQWFGKEFGVNLSTTTGLKALEQPKAAHEGLKEYVEGLDDDHFTILQAVTPLCGSVILGVAFVDRVLSPQEAFAAVRVEEGYKAELYNEKTHGPDPSQEKKDKAAMTDLEAAAQYLSCLS